MRTLVQHRAVLRLGRRAELRVDKQGAGLYRYLFRFAVVADDGKNASRKEVPAHHTDLLRETHSLRAYPHSPGKGVSVNGAFRLWICPTYNSEGRAACPSKMIPEDTLTALTADIDLSSVEHMIAEDGNVIRVRFKDGTERMLRWKERSRAESWTQEMRQAAREAARKGGKKDGQR